MTDKITPDFVRKIRNKMSLSQEKFGEQICYSGRYIRMIENGEKPISPRFAQQMRALAVLCSAT